MLRTPLAQDWGFYTGKLLKIETIRLNHGWG